MVGRSSLDAKRGLRRRTANIDAALNPNPTFERFERWHIVFGSWHDHGGCPT